MCKNITKRKKKYICRQRIQLIESPIISISHLSESHMYAFALKILLHCAYTQTVFMLHYFSQQISNTRINQRDGCKGGGFPSVARSCYIRGYNHDCVHNTGAAVGNIWVCNTVSRGSIHPMTCGNCSTYKDKIASHRKNRHNGPRDGLQNPLNDPQSRPNTEP